MTYIIKTDRALTCYYYSEGRLLKRILNEKGLSAELWLMSGIRPLFSLNLTEKGEVYIFCRDLKGNVILLKEGKDGAAKKVLLENKGSDFSGSILFDAVIKDNEIDLLYNTPSERGLHGLYIQKLGEEPRPPHYIDGAYPLNGRAFRVTHINPRLRTVFYLKRSGENRLGYREILDDREGVYNSVFSSGAAFGDFSLCANSRELHFAAAANTFFSSRLLYRFRGADGFAAPKAAADMGNITFPLVFLFKGRPALFFKSAGKPYITYDLSSPKSFKGKICSELSRAAYIDKTNRGTIWANEVLVDSNKPWDIQLYPEIDGDYYSFKTPKNEKGEASEREYDLKALFSKKGSAAL